MKRFFRVLPLVSFVWVFVIVLFFVIQDVKINEDDFFTKKASVVSASCNSSRSFLGVDVQLQYEGEISVVKETLQIIENIDCDEKLLNLLQAQGVSVTTYKNWQIEIVTGGVSLMTMKRGISSVSDFSSLRAFLIFIGLISTFFSFLYVVKKVTPGTGTP